MPQNNFYNEELSYDLNGNILSLQRNAKSFYTNMAEQIDNLSYTYTGNRLNTVTDASANYQGYPDTSGTPMTYDANGNMTKHEDKGILNISYNFLNLPKDILFNQEYIVREPGEFDQIKNVSSTYLYRADGTKLRKNYAYGVKGTEKIKTTEYLDGFQYEVTNSAVQILQFVPTAEGYFDFVKNAYIYHYADHLDKQVKSTAFHAVCERSSVRLSYFKSGSSAAVLEENSYYPFGLQHINALSVSSYKYKYNGKELQETGMYDYGARFYMPDAVIWGQHDPLAEVSRRFSPYAYAFNNPIRYIDPDG
ncbi:RHS repeat domain-containing protein, partial [Chryseobacterium sp. MFBS3-17]|uniref:RHS repeat domain-containing protein n=1 Tax=Chryseobacterium sp. MFBS3-17 TaxID=2886689 RepID=UPI001D0DEF60